MLTYAPFGFRRDEEGLLVPCPEQQRTLFVIRALREDFRFTYQRVADALNAQGMLTARGLPWTKDNVMRVIHRGRLLAIGTPPDIDVKDDGTILIDSRGNVIDQDRVISCEEIEPSLAEQAKQFKREMRRLRRSSR